jgi:preprotein translocase subunit YajC
VKAAILFAVIDAIGDTPSPSGDPATPSGGGGGNQIMWVFLIVAAVLMYVMSRRNKKKQGDANAFRSELAPGQRVMTMSGLVGVIVRVEGDLIVVASGNGDESQWIRRAIRALMPDDEWNALITEYPDDPDEIDEADESAEIDSAPADDDTPEDDGDAGTAKT